MANGVATPESTQTDIGGATSDLGLGGAAPDAGQAAQAALGGAMATQPSAAAPTGAGPGGGYDPLAGIQQLLGTLNQMPQVPAAANVQQRHGGVLTGLAGVLLDGLASGLAPTAQQAFERPMQRQQQQMQMQQMQLQQQQAQMEMAMAPIKMKAQMAQSLINILQAGHMLRDLSKEHQIDMLGAQAKYTQEAIDQGRARLDATAPDLQSAQKRAQELQAQNKDKALNFGIYPTKWDEAGNATEYGIYESYPQGALQKDFDYDFEGDKELGIAPEHVHLPAGMQESEARLRLSGIANEHATTMKIASDRMLAVKMQQQMDKEDFNEKEKLKADARATQTLALALQRNQMQADRPGVAEVAKYGMDFQKSDLSVQTLRRMLDAGATGNQVANQLAQLSTALMSVSTQGVHRINTTELGISGPEAEAFTRRIEAMLDKNISGSLPEGYQKDLKQLADLFETEQIRKYKAGVDMVNEQNAATMPGYIRVPYAFTPRQQALAAKITDAGGAGGGGGGTAGPQKGDTKVYQGATYEFDGTQWKKR